MISNRINQQIYPNSNVVFKELKINSPTPGSSSVVQIPRDGLFDDDPRIRARIKQTSSVLSFAVPVVRRVGSGRRARRCADGIRIFFYSDKRHSQHSTKLYKRGYLARRLREMERPRRGVDFVGFTERIRMTVPSSSSRVRRRRRCRAASGYRA